jgi:hypothetical protein
MTEEKFDKRYFEINYHIEEVYKEKYKNVVHRNEDSSGESHYEVCLRACLTHFIGEDLTGAKRISDHFVTDHRLHKDHLKRCCCSKEVWRTDDEGTNQRVSIYHAVVTHKLTELSFIVGKDCFHKLFVNAQDANTFFKETCKYCGEIVAKRSADRPYLCNQDCVENYKKQEKAQQELLRQEEFNKKWAIEAQQRKEEQKRKEYAKMLKDKELWCLRNLEKDFSCCVNCEKPKTNDFEKKWPFCTKCHNKANQH